MWSKYRIIQYTFTLMENMYLLVLFSSANWKYEHCIYNDETPHSVFETLSMSAILNLMNRFV